MHRLRMFTAQCPSCHRLVTELNGTFGPSYAALALYASGGDTNLHEQFKRAGCDPLDLEKEIVLQICKTCKNSFSRAKTTAIMHVHGSKSPSLLRKTKGRESLQIKVLFTTMDGRPLVSSPHCPRPCQAPVILTFTFHDDMPDRMRPVSCQAQPKFRTMQRPSPGASTCPETRAHLCCWAVRECCAPQAGK